MGTVYVKEIITAKKGEKGFEIVHLLSSIINETGREYERYLTQKKQDFVFDVIYS